MDPDNIKLLYEAFFAIAESYTSIVYLDTTDNSVHPIRLDDYSKRYEERFAGNSAIKDVLDAYIKETVCKEDVEELMRLADCDHVLERLKTENPILHIYRAVHDDKAIYYRLKIVPIEDGKKIIYGFENIDSQYRKQLEIKAQNEKYMTILDGLSREFMSVWYVDGKSRKVSLIRNNGTDAENGEAVRIGSTMVDYHFSMQKYFRAFVGPEDFDRLMHDTGFEYLVQNVRDDELFNINYIRINPDGSKSHFQVCYAKMVDSTGTANFVMGFRNMDSAY